MKKQTHKLAAMAVVILTAGALLGTSVAADSSNPIKEGMKAYHKAPKGVDTVSKKAVEGKATPEELKKLVDCYAAMAAAKPPRGDEGSWKEKTGKLLIAAQSLQKGDAGATARYKDAVNCKACHSAHKPE